MVKIDDLKREFEDYKRETNQIIEDLKAMIFGPDGNPEQGLTHRVVALEMARHVTGGRFQEWLEPFTEEEKTPDRIRQILAVFRGAGCNVTVEADLQEEAKRLWDDAADAEQDYETARVLAEDHREEHRNALIQANQMFEEAQERFNASDARKLLDLINEGDGPDDLPF